MHWFHTGEGKLIVGEAAYEVAVENSQPGDIVPLVDAVFAKELWFDTTTFEKTDVRAWTDDDYRNYGRWVIHILSQDERYRLLSRNHIDRLSKLGVGPSHRPFLRVSGPGFTDFQRSIDAPIYNEHVGNFEHWTRKNYAEYAGTLASTFGRPATTDEFDLAAQAKEGPSSWVMTRNVGTPGEVNELLGFPNVYMWQREDFIAWGAHTIDINGGVKLTRTILNYLSKKGRGPSTSTTISEFGSLTAFQSTAHERYLTDPTSRKPREEKAKQRIVELASKRLINRWQLGHIAANSIDIVEFIAKYDVASDLLLTPEFDELELGYIALEPADCFADVVLKALPTIDIEDIHLAAIATGHTDDIWPLSDKWRDELIVNIAA